MTFEAMYICGFNYSQKENTEDLSDIEFISKFSLVMIFEDFFLRRN